MKITTSGIDKIAAEVLEALKKNIGKTLTVSIVDDDNNLMYSWTFAGAIVPEEVSDIELTVDFDAPAKKTDIEKLFDAGKVKPMYVNFAHHGRLPGAATIRTYVGKNFSDGKEVYLYYYDEAADEILAEGSKALEVKDGYVEYTITHCSTYFLSETKLDVKSDANGLADANVHVRDLSVKDVDAGGNTAKYAILLFLIGFAAAKTAVSILNVRRNTGR